MRCIATRASSRRLRLGRSMKSTTAQWRSGLGSANQASAPAHQMMSGSVAGQVRGDRRLRLDDVGARRRPRPPWAGRATKDAGGPSAPGHVEAHDLGSQFGCEPRQVVRSGVSGSRPPWPARGCTRTGPAGASGANPSTRRLGASRNTHSVRAPRVAPSTWPSYSGGPSGLLRSLTPAERERGASETANGAPGVSPGAPFRRQDRKSGGVGQPPAPSRKSS